MKSTPKPKPKSRGRAWYLVISEKRKGRIRGWVYSTKKEAIHVAKLFSSEDHYWGKHGVVRVEEKK